MNQDLQSILDIIEHSPRLSDAEKNTLAKAARSAGKELEIEASLERVRTVAMSMNKPDDMLHVCRMISDQLELLHVEEIRNVQTAIFYKEKGTYMNYEYYAKHNKTCITETTYTNHEIQQEFADRMLKGNGEVMTAHIKGDKVKDWVTYQKTTNVFIDDYLNTASSLNYYWYSLGPVALGISTYTPMAEDQTILFRRFLKVFELSYRRYLDIENAEAQAHEAKVEASLEKVRAVAMSMNQPEDLLNICETVYKEFSAFGFADLRNAMINIHDDENKSFVNYDYSVEMGKSTNHLRNDLHPVINNQIRQIRTAKDAFSETVFAGKDLAAWKEFRKKIGEKDDPRIKKATALYYYLYSIGTGSIGISTFSPVDDEKIKLLKRFRNVFTLSYQRYADLALAKTQAREAQIELALERIRARTMAMQKSDELAETASVLFKQLIDLGIKTTQMRTCAIVTLKPDEPIGECWITKPDGDIIPRSFMVPYDETSAYKTIYEAWQNGEKFLVVHLSGNALTEHLDFLKKYANIPTRQFQALPDHPAETFTHAMFFSQGYLFVISNEPLPGFHEIFKRFGTV